MIYVKVGVILFSVIWYLYIVFNYCLIRFKLEDIDNISLPDTLKILAYCMFY